MSIRYISNSDNFKAVPGQIFCYWLSDIALEHMKKDKKLDEKGRAKQGLSTSDNNRFLRFWHEVRFSNIDFSCKSCEETENSICRWFPYNKAGNFRRWSSINEYVVNYQNNGAEIKATVMKKYPYLNGPGFVVKNTESYFHHGITWNDVATGLFCARYVPDGFIFADAGPMFFCSDDFLMLGFFNTNVFQMFASIICQGLHYSTGHIPQIPFKEVDDNDKDEVKQLTIENYELSKNEWDSFENSWDFKRHPLV